MKAVVVYESVFGNTREIAEAVAEGLRESGEVEVRPVADALDEIVEAVDVLVVGGPTHIHGMASKRSMKAAAEDAKKRAGADLQPGSGGPVLRDWLGQLPRGRRPSAAAFDTRLDKSVLLTGAASKKIAQRLRGQGFELVIEPESFIVGDSPGPLLAGELERARNWGKSIAAAAGRSTT